MFSWTVSKGGGPKRYYHAAVAVRKKLYSFGGVYNGRYDKDQMDVHVFDTMSLLWKKLPPVRDRKDGQLEVPSGRYGHTAVLLCDTVYIWGGDIFCNVLYAFDVDALRWLKLSRVSGAVPKARWYHSACVLGKVMFIQGGYDLDQHVQQLNGLTNDMYKLDTSTMLWSLINTRGTPPSASTRHSATIIGTKMFVFGGEWTQWSPSRQYIYYNTIRVFDTETNYWLNTPYAQLLPEGRFGHSAFTYNGELYIFGGGYAQMHQKLNDLWKFSPETFSWKKVEPKGKHPSPLFGMCCCMVGDRFILFGGKTNTGIADDMFILDLSPSLKTLCKLTVIQYGLEQSDLPHDLRWELAAMTTNSSVTHSVTHGDSD